MEETQHKLRDFLRIKFKGLISWRRNINLNMIMGIKELIWQGVSTGNCTFSSSVAMVSQMNFGIHINCLKIEFKNILDT